MKTKLYPLLFVLGGTLCLMLAAFYNKFPIFFSDSGTYMSSGFDMRFPIDRPISYGLFIKYFSFNGMSLWLPVFFQSLILSYVLYLAIRLALGNNFRYWIAALIYIFLSLFASASWVTSMIMADVFTPIGIISGTLILFGKYNKGTLTLLFLIFLVAATVHFSHILIFSLLFAGAFIFKKWILPKAVYPKRHLRALALVGLTLCSIFIMKPSLDQGKAIMFVSTMFSQDISQQYLKDYCGEKNYKLCAYKDSIPSGNGVATWLEYNPHSPIIRLGGWNDEMRTECADIMFGTLTKPKYIWLHILASLRCSFIQLYSFKTGGGNIPYLDEYPVVANVRTYFKNDMMPYFNSRQNKDTLMSIYGWWNDILTVVVVLSLILLLMLAIIRKSVFKGVFGYMTILFLAGVILNAWDCGTFSDINLRYDSRVMWLIPLLACLALTRFFSKTNPGESSD